MAILAREAVLLACLPVLRRYGYGPPPVHYLGKTATFVLLVAFPVLLLAYASDAAAVWAHPVGWAWPGGAWRCTGSPACSTWSQVVAVVRRARAEPA